MLCCLKQCRDEKASDSIHRLANASSQDDAADMFFSLSSSFPEARPCFTKKHFQLMALLESHHRCLFFVSFSISSTADRSSLQSAMSILIFRHRRQPQSVTTSAHRHDGREWGFYAHIQPETPRQAIEHASSHRTLFNPSNSFHTHTLPQTQIRTLSRPISTFESTRIGPARIGN